MAIGAALVDEPDDARSRLRGYRFRANENEDKREGNSSQVSRHTQSIDPAGGPRSVAFVPVRASIDEIADQPDQRERDHSDDADDKRKIQAVRTG
jgi:hypothetical protein